jgi:hypothetical protein
MACARRCDHLECATGRSRRVPNDRPLYGSLTLAAKSAVNIAACIAIIAVSMPPLCKPCPQPRDAPANLVAAAAIVRNRCIIWALFLRLYPISSSVYWAKW